MLLRLIKNFSINAISIFVAHYVMVLIHLSIHSLLGWSFGLLKSAFSLSYLSLPSLPLFLIDKRTNFESMLLSGHNILTAIVVITPNIFNILLFALFFYLANVKKIQKNIHFFYFIYWLMIMNFGQIYNLTYRLSITPGDDFQVFSDALNISYLWVLTPAVIFVIFGYLGILVYKIPQAYKVLKFHTTFRQSIFLFNTLLILFGYFGGFLYEIIYKSYYYLIYPILLIFLFFMVCFPKNHWVQKRMNKVPTKIE